MRSIRKTRTRGGWTVVDALVGTAVVAVVGAALVPMLGTGLHRSGMMVSANNLRRLGQGHAAYEASWNGQQHTTMVAEMGLFSGPNACGSFLEHHCPPPPVVIGTDPQGGTWAYRWNGALPTCTSHPGGSPFCSGGTTSRFPALSVPLRVPKGGRTGGPSVVRSAAPQPARPAERSARRRKPSPPLPLRAATRVAARDGTAETGAVRALPSVELKAAASVGRTAGPTCRLGSPP